MITNVKIEKPKTILWPAINKKAAAWPIQCRNDHQLKAWQYSSAVKKKKMKVLSKSGYYCEKLA